MICLLGLPNRPREHVVGSLALTAKSVEVLANDCSFYFLIWSAPQKRLRDLYQLTGSQPVQNANLKLCRKVAATPVRGFVICRPKEVNFSVRTTAATLLTLP